MVVDLPYDDPQTIAEMAQNDKTALHNAAETGLISDAEAKDAIDEVEQTNILNGDGWFDRYGPPPVELQYLYDGQERYWEIDPKDRR